MVIYIILFLYIDTAITYLACLVEIFGSTKTDFENSFTNIRELHYPNLT